jgi:hypothetical protein
MTITGIAIAALIIWNIFLTIKMLRFRKEYMALGFEFWDSINDLSRQINEKFDETDKAIKEIRK